MPTEVVQACFSILPVGFLLLALVAMKKDAFWPGVLFAAIFGAGPMVAGYAVVDEALLAFAILGVCIPLGTGRRKLYKRRFEVCLGSHEFFFRILIVYMFCQSLRGMVALQDLRMVRFMAYFPMIWLTSFVICHGKYAKPDGRSVARWLMVWGGLYFVFYLAQGAYFGGDAFLRMADRFHSQGQQWAGTAAAVFPMIVLAPAGILLLQREPARNHFMIVLTLAFALSVCAYYSSRVGVMCFLAYLLVAVASSGVSRRSAALVAGITIAGVIAANSEAGRHAMRAWQVAIFEGGLMILSPGESDVGRQTHLIASFVRLAQDPLTLLIGDGYYVHRLSLKSALLELGYTSILYRNPGSIQSVGFTALLVDTGVLGVGLVAINVYLACKTCWMLSRGETLTVRILPSLMCVFALLWLTVSNVLDMVLYFMLFMPGGLATQLSKHPAPRPATRWRGLLVPRASEVFISGKP